MRLTSSQIVMLAIGIAAAAIFGLLMPRAVLLAWLTIAASASTAALGAAMLTCMLKLGHSRLLDTWNAPLSMAVPWLYVAPVLCLPFVIGVGTLYHWNTDAVFADQRGYLNVPFFAIRMLLYFAAFIGIAIALPKVARTSRFTAVMLIAFVVANMIGVDSIMALTPQWHSSDFGLRWCVNGLLIAASLAIAWQSIHRRGTGEDETRARIDGATLLFALDLGWLYLMFVDYVTAWSGNLPDEVIWYAPRVQGAWGIVIVAIVTAHVVVGFLLLSRMIKRSATALFWLAALMIVAQWLEATWTVIPGTDVDTRIALGVSSLAVVALIGAPIAWRRGSRPPRKMAHG